ncbi:MAG TPA: 5'-nucleotidase [Lachnospiraceae bacterium]|nr:5'-nucleotidase [Lachnospiraceae bacterium]
MPYSLDNKLVIGVSSRALFDLTKENEIFESEGLDSYCRYQVEHETDILNPGPGFSLIKALLNINKLPQQEGRVEVIVMSRNSADSSLRVFNAIEHYGLNISRAVLASGASLAPYLNAFKTDLFLSAYEDDVQSAINSNIAAGIICSDGIHTYHFNKEITCIKIAFDGDAVLFTDDSEKIFQEQGLEAFEMNEKINAKNPLSRGPFAKFLKTISDLQKEFSVEQVPIRTALVTSRGAPAHQRVIRTLRAWDVRIDEAFFLGGISKKEVLEAFGANIFFDDQAVHTIAASEVVPSARVPYKKSMESQGIIKDVKDGI